MRIGGDETEGEAAGGVIEDAATPCSALKLGAIAGVLSIYIDRAFS